MCTFKYALQKMKDSRTITVDSTSSYELKSNFCCKKIVVFKNKSFLELKDIRCYKYKHAIDAKKLGLCPPLKVFFLPELVSNVL